MIAPIITSELKERTLFKTERGTQGFGSTGIEPNRTDVSIAIGRIMYPKELGMRLTPEELEQLSQDLYLRQEIQEDQELAYDLIGNIRIQQIHEDFETESSYSGINRMLMEGAGGTVNPRPPPIAPPIQQAPSGTTTEVPRLRGNKPSPRPPPLATKDTSRNVTTPIYYNPNRRVKTKIYKPEAPIHL